MEEIIKSIIEAEEHAEEIKAQALSHAAEIAENAQVRAAEIEKESAEECKKFRENALKKAQAEAQAKYDAEIAEAHNDAKKFVAEHLERCELQIKEIVRRVSDGNR
ncbi:MAG: hypothetical protein ACI4MN_06820 [Candidatus Coproplasma sp.]